MNYHITISIPYWFRTPHPGRRFEPTGAADRKSWKFADWVGVSESRYVKRQANGSHIATTCRVARPPDGADRVLRPADGDFYIRASGGLVTRSAAGYHYSGNWASST